MAAVLSCLIAALCLARPLAAIPAPSQHLDSCVRCYQDGEYVQAVGCITEVFPLLHEHDELRAYKYLAYSYVMLQMTTRASTVFGAALERYPGMRLDTLEVPPRIWSFFEEVRLQRRATRPATIRQNRAVQVSIASLMLAGAGAGLWSSGYIAASGTQSIALAGSIIAGAASVALISASLSIIVSRDPRKKKRIVLQFDSPVNLAAGVITREAVLP